jgi:HSP20 family protein
MLYDTKNFQKRRSLNEGFWDDFTNRDVMQDYHIHRPSAAPSVNILRDDDEYRIELIAPGLCRDHYDIQVNEDILAIRAEKPDTKEDEAQFERREYYTRNFERSFVLPKNVKQESISASCTDGILTIHVPLKAEDNREKRRTIEIN